MEKYKALKGRKVYLVFDPKIDFAEIYEEAKQYFKASIRDIELSQGFLYKDELYFGSCPYKKGVKEVVVAEQYRRRT